MRIFPTSSAKVGMRFFGQFVFAIIYFMTVQDVMLHAFQISAGDFLSHLLESVSGDRVEREKKQKDSLKEDRELSKEGRGKEILQWETETLLAPPAITQMRTLWEVC